MLARGQLILGAEVESFEERFASYIGVNHCVGVASGTDALTLALEALGVGAQDEVITVALTSAGTAAGIAATGARVRYVDVEPETLGMDPIALAAAIGPRTAAIVPVHLHGTPCCIHQILAIAQQHGLVVVEDCAQAHGASVHGRRVGSFGHAAAFSFYPTKNLGCLGDGGAVVTASPEVAARVRRTREYGWSEDRVSLHWGMNSRLDAIQAAILDLQMQTLDIDNNRRRNCAARYRSLLRDVPVSLPLDTDGSVYHQFCIKVAGRDNLARRMKSLGVGTSVHFPVGLHRQPPFADGSTQLPVTEYLTDRLLSLPIQPEVIEGCLDHVVQCLRDSLE